MMEITKHAYSYDPFISQTVEAMKTILGDLRPEDLFSIIDFNHNIRSWRDDLVTATPSQIEDAKKYIQGIQPNGGMWV